MPSYGYVGKAHSGLTMKGSIEAPSRAAALESLRKQGIIITSLREPTQFNIPSLSGGASEPVPTDARGLMDFFGFTGVSQKDLAVWTRKFAHMLRAGVDYNYVFNILSSETENRRLAAASKDIHQQILAGRTMTEAFTSHPGVFPAVFLSMIHAGEVAGRMDTIMEELANVYDKEVELRASIMSRMYYPIGLLVVALLLIGAMITIVPRMLPSESQSIFARFFDRNTYLLVVMFYGSIAAFLLFLRTKPGYTMFRATLAYVPYIGVLLKKLSLIRFCRLMAAMWSSGVPMLEAMEVAEETVAEPYMKKGVREASRMVNEGYELADALRASGVFPERVTSLVATGEAAGNVEATLIKVAEYYELEAEAQGNIVAVAGYFVVYGIIALTVGFFVISAWSGYFGIISDVIDGNF